MNATGNDQIGDPPTPWQRRCIDAAARILPTCPGVLAVWIGGSLARGDGDEFSDVDLNCLVSDGSLGFWREHWSDVVARLVGPLMLARTINDSIIGGFTLTDDWEHVDLILHPRETFVRPADCHLLHDPQALIDDSPAPAPSRQPMNVGDTSEFFCYLAGSFATLIGRRELALAQSAVISLRQWLIQLMLIESGRRPAGGARRLNQFLTAEHRRVLENIGALLGSPAETSAAAALVFYDFAARAERLAVADGSDFPASLLATTQRHLRRTLGPLWPAADLSPGRFGR